MIAVALFTRFSMHDKLSRDEAIYAYAGQQQAEGVPPYVSIFDPKAPLASLASGGAVAAGRALGWGDVHAIRTLFFAFACLAVLALYLLATWLFGSPVVGLVSASTLASFEGFALDALTGPNAKTPALLFAIVSLALLVRGRHFWSAFTGSLAFLTWQPFGVYPLLAIAAAALAAEAGARGRRTAEATAGAAIPVLLVVVYFWAVGALRDLVDAAVIFPVTPVEDAGESLVGRLERVDRRIDYAYPNTKALLWIGLLVLVALLVVRLARGRGRAWAVLRDDPFVLVAASFFPVAVFLAFDFQGYSDVYPALPYAAIGIGAGARIVLDAIAERLVPALAAAAGAVAVAALVVVSWVSMSTHPAPVDGLLRQCGNVAKIERLLGRHETVYAMGSAVPLVLMRRRNPSRYIYLAAGIDQWKVEHTPGGFDGWKREIRAADPAVVIVSGRWHGEHEPAMRAWLRSQYVPMFRGRFSVFAKPAIYERAERRREARAEAEEQAIQQHLAASRRSGDGRAHGDSAPQCLAR